MRRPCHPAVFVLALAGGTGGCGDTVYVVEPVFLTQGPGADTDSGAALDTSTPVDTGEPSSGNQALAPDADVRIAGDHWNGLIIQPDAVHVTTMRANQLQVSVFDRDLGAVGEADVWMANEPVSGFQVTDHALAIHEDTVYIAVSDHHAERLVVAAYTVDGGVVHPPRQVLRDSDAPTNDMKLVVRDGILHLLYGYDGPEKRRLEISLDLEQVDGPIEQPTPGHTSQLGCLVVTDTGFLRVAGNFDNHQLVAEPFSESWEVSDGDAWTLPIPAGTDEWNWFSTGCVQDPATGDWFVAHQHMWEGNDADTQSSVRLSHFDADWNHIQTVSASEPRGFTRPHLSLTGHDLYLAYDRVGEIRALRYPLDPTRH